MQRPAIAHLKLIAPRVSGVQQRNRTAGHDIGALRAVHQRRIADKTTASRFAILRRPKVIQPFITDNDGKIIPP